MRLLPQMPAHSRPSAGIDAAYREHDRGRRNRGKRRACKPRHRQEQRQTGQVRRWRASAARGSVAAARTARASESVCLTSAASAGMHQGRGSRCSAANHVVLGLRTLLRCRARSRSMPLTVARRKNAVCATLARVSLHAVWCGGARAVFRPAPAPRTLPRSSPRGLLRRRRARQGFNRAPKCDHASAPSSPSLPPSIRLGALRCREPGPGCTGRAGQTNRG